MSHHNEAITCPNCGFHADNNYCAQCGQDNRLHDDTTWGLVMHSVEHYFHYDNKFWQTLKVMLLKPGELTLAYWNKQRARYIAPFALYIFISAIAFLAGHLYFNVIKERTLAETSKATPIGDAYKGLSAMLGGAGKIAHAIDVATEDPKKLFDTLEDADRYRPKIMFFFIPLTALILKLLFARRGTTFASHVVFSLHCHSVYFVSSLVTYALSIIPFLVILSLPVTIGLILYYIAAMRKAYKISTGKAIGYTFIVGLIYSLMNLGIMGCFLVYRLG